MVDGSPHLERMEPSGSSRWEMRSPPAPRLGRTPTGVTFGGAGLIHRDVIAAVRGEHKLPALIGSPPRDKKRASNGLESGVEFRYCK